MTKPIQRIRGLLVSQFFGAFNDNAWKLVVTFLAIRFLQISYGGDPASFQARSQSQATLTFCILTLPLILFSIRFMNQHYGLHNGFKTVGSIAYLHILIG